MLFGRAPTDYVFALALWITSIAYAVTAYGYPETARALPLLVGFFLVVLSTIDLVSMTQTAAGVWLRRINVAGAPGSRGRDSSEASLGKQLFAWSFVMGFVVMLFVIGTLPATAIYVAASIHFLGRRRLFTSLVVGALVALFSYSLFELSLQVELYRGIFFER